MNQIAAEIGKGPADVQKFADILEENWYDSEVAIRAVKQEELDKMGIPKFLAKKIIDKLAGGNIDNLQPKESKGMDIERPSSKDPHAIIPPVVSNEFQIYDSKLKQVFKEFISGSEKIESLTIISKIFSNILKEPENEKFRKLSLSNGKLVIHLWRFIPVVEFLTLIGFHRIQDDFLFLEYGKIRKNHIQHCFEKIEAEIKTEGSSSPKFNPYAAHFTSKNPDFNIESLEKISNFESAKVHDQLKELKQKREHLIKTHKVVTKAKIIPPSFEINQKLIIQEEKSPEGETEEDTSSDVYVLRQAIIDFQRNFSGEATFQNARKKEYDMFLKEPLDLETTIRVRLPNKYVIEANFSPNDSPRKLFAVINEQLLHSEARYYIYIPPFIKDKIYNDDVKGKTNTSFRDLGMSPNAKFELLYEEVSINKEPVLLKSQNK